MRTFLMKNCVSRCTTYMVLGLAASPTTALSADGQSGGQSLDQAANDPTASLMNIQVQNLYSGAYHILEDESGNVVQIRSAT